MGTRQLELLIFCQTGLLRELNEAMQKEILIVYRGPLERTRLAFIFESLLQPNTAARLIWIFPGKLSDARRAFSEDFLRQYLSHVTIFEHRLIDYFSTRAKLRQAARAFRGREVYGVGFSSLAFLHVFSTKEITWFINGIPEERDMEAAWSVSRLYGWMTWQINRWFAPKPKRIITVSSRMSQYVLRHIKSAPVHHVPTCVDLSTFRNDAATRKGYFVYCGSGAPWQALDLLKNVWDEIHRADASIRFRIVSRDDRCRLLMRDIDPSCIEMVRSNDHREVAVFLNECSIAFMLRKDNIVNRVCFPTKFAEYLAAGCAVVTTDLDWDVKDYMNDAIGLELDLSASPTEMALSVLRFHRQLRSTPPAIADFAFQLDRKRWVAKASAVLSQ
jgi:glycosyltransferase involved in cell wall biosynthesis